MKKILRQLCSSRLKSFSISFFSLVFGALLGEERILLDGIVVLSAGESGITPVYYSDGWHLTAFGTKKSLEDAVIKALWTQYGQEHGIRITGDEILDAAEKQLEFLQEERGISRSKIEKMAEEMGYTLTDIKRELGGQMLLQKTLEMSFSANGYLNISHEEMIDYYDQFPVIEHGFFSIRLGLKKDKEGAAVLWEATPLILKKHEISDKFLTIETAGIGEIFYEEWDEAKQATIYYKLIDRTDERVIPFEEAYEEIYKILQQKKYAESYKRMSIGFLDSPLTYFFDTKMRAQCIDFLLADRMEGS